MNGSKQDIETQFDELIAEHWKTISKLCASCASNTGVPVDDLLQECLVDLWVHFCTLQDESGGPFEPASLILCCRNAISHFKRRFLRHSLLPLDDHLAETLPDSDTSKYRELLDYLTRNLSPHDKKAFSFIEQGCSNLELANEMHITPQSAKLLRHRIIKKIRKDNPNYIKDKK